MSRMLVMSARHPAFVEPVVRQTSTDTTSVVLPGPRGVTVQIKACLWQSRSTQDFADSEALIGAQTKQDTTCLLPGRLVITRLQVQSA